MTHTREVLAVLKAAGYQPFVEHSKHIKIKWLGHSGRSFMLVISRSPSDRFAQINSHAQLRRLIRSDRNGDVSVAR